MNRRNFIKTSSINLAGLNLFPEILFKEFKKEPEYTLLNEFQIVKLPFDFVKEEYLAQKIKPNSPDILPFIFKRKGAFLRKEDKKEYLFKKVKTWKGKYAEEIFEYSPYQMYLNEKNITDKTLITEKSFSDIKKIYMKDKTALKPDENLIKTIFNEDYLFEEVAYCYEDENEFLFSTDFYIMPVKNLEIKLSSPFMSPIIVSPEGIYKGYSLELADPDTREKPYKLELY